MADKLVADKLVADKLDLQGKEVSGRIYGFLSGKWVILRKRVFSGGPQKDLRRWTLQKKMGAENRKPVKESDP